MKLIEIAPRISGMFATNCTFLETAPAGGASSAPAEPEGARNSTATTIASRAVTGRLTTALMCPSGQAHKRWGTAELGLVVDDLDVGELVHRDERKDPSDEVAGGAQVQAAVV